MMGGSGGDPNANASGMSSPLEAPSLTPSPPPTSQQGQFKHTPLNSTGPPRLVALQEPQENFHKDEGGKANQLSFRVILQGELLPDILANAVDGCLLLSVRPVFDDGELAEPSVLDIVGGTDGTNPCIQLRSRLGGVRYRLRTVSKRLGNRGIGVILYVVGCPSIEPIKSEPTMVFSKRKNKEQRLEEQARERNELLERQRAAQLLLSARASPSASDLPLNGGGLALSPVGGMNSSSSGGELPSVMSVVHNAMALNQQESHTNLHTSMPQATSAATGGGPGTTISSTGALKFPSSGLSNVGLPPPFVPAAPAIVRPRPRRISRDKEHDSDSDASHDSSGANSSTNTSKRKKHKYVNGAAGRPNNQKHLEDRVAKLEAALEANIKEVEEMRAAMNLCFYQLGGTANAAGLRRSSSQNVPWEFAEPSTNFDTHGSVRDQLVGGLTMISPQPTRSPFEIDSWVNGGSLNGPEGQPLRLRRDVSNGSSQVPSPRSSSAVLHLPSVPKRSPSSESLS